MTVPVTTPAVFPTSTVKWNTYKHKLLPLLMKTYGAFKSAGADSDHSVHRGGEHLDHTTNRETHQLPVVVKKVNWQTPYSPGRFERTISPNDNHDSQPVSSHSPVLITIQIIIIMQESIEMFNLMSLKQ